MRRHIEVDSEVVAKRLYRPDLSTPITGNTTRYGTKGAEKIPLGTRGVVEDVGEVKHFRDTWKVYLVHFDGFEPLWFAASDICPYE